MENTPNSPTAFDPCGAMGGFLGNHKLWTDRGLIGAEDAFVRSTRGDHVQAACALDRLRPWPTSEVRLTELRVRPLGVRAAVQVRFADGSAVAGSAWQRVWTRNRGWVPLCRLVPSDVVERANLVVPRACATALPPPSDLLATTARQVKELYLPTCWTTPLCHYLGWLVGDGCLTPTAVVTVYGSAADQSVVLPMHRHLIEGIAGNSLTPSVQANGTLQLRLTRRHLVAYLRELGFSMARAAEKVVPRAIAEAPRDAVAAFLSGLFDADGCVVNQSGNQTRYVGLGSSSELLVRDVQQLLASCFGIRSRIYVCDSSNRTFAYTRKGDGRSVVYQARGPLHDLRITGEGIRTFHEAIGFRLPAKQERLEVILATGRFYRKDPAVRVAAIEDFGRHPVFALATASETACVVGGNIVPGERINRGL
ncbi:LAGLIDADG family homing endonuclease [Yinghuangia seranimata]|uniref:LAGLIDADG family homing endonuclease n=1 Tax=Yinghuangia seranimata TaxID=408067 RepID=UPI00248B46AC|nr:LAGLIDADG family homing endonuclease [Yinghuangia seranimata]MDI2128651.1 LAGLIDADG family homing endonuclease [Yinghuangia seranimata]